MIWFKKDLQLSDLQSFMGNTMASHLGLKFTEIGDNYLKMSMPVNEKTTQPYGYVHGGANCVLIETAGSVGSVLTLDASKKYCVGIEINANHLRSVTEGLVIATATPLHLGRTTHVWEVKIHDEQGRLTCAGRHTVAVIEHLRK